MTNYFESLKTKPRISMNVDFPIEVDGKVFQVAMVILTAQESASAKAEAEKKAQKFLNEAHGKNQGHEELYNDFCCLYIIWNSIRLVNDITKHFFPHPDAILQVLTVDHIGILMNNYYDLLAHKGPIIVEMDEEETREWAETMIKDGTSRSFMINTVTLELTKKVMDQLITKVKDLETKINGQESIPSI